MNSQPINTGVKVKPMSPTSSEPINELAEQYRSGVLPTGDTKRQATVLQLQRENPELYFATVNAVQHRTQREILHGLAQQSGEITYDLLDDYVTVQKRTVRKHAKQLEEQNVIERIDSRSYRLAFASDTARILGHEALRAFFNKL